MGRKVQRIWPKHLQTVGEMLRQNVDVFAHCPKCQTDFEVDLETLAILYTGHYSLIGRHGKCKRRGCGGRVFFNARIHTVFVPLLEGD